MSFKQDLSKNKNIQDNISSNTKHFVQLKSSWKVHKWFRSATLPENRPLRKGIQPVW